MCLPDRIEWTLERNAESYQCCTGSLSLFPLSLFSLSLSLFSPRGREMLRFAVPGAKQPYKPACR